MKLYEFPPTRSIRPRWMLQELEVPFESVWVNLPKGEHRRPEYAAVDPQALLPTLVDGERALSQSLAIIEYLEETRPEPPLLPADAAGRARVRSLSLLIACEIHPLNNLRTLQHLKRALGQSEEQINAWYRHWIADGFGKLEPDLSRDKSGGGAGRFCHGDTPTMADCCLVPQVFNAKRYSADLGPYPTLMRIFDACMKLEAFDRAQPSKQPDAE